MINSSLMAARDSPVSTTDKFTEFRVVVGIVDERDGSIENDIHEFHIGESLEKSAKLRGSEAVRKPPSWNAHYDASSTKMGGKFFKEDLQRKCIHQFTHT